MPHSRRSLFDRLPDGREVEAVTLDSGEVQATILAFGATLQSLITPDRDGHRADIVLGHDAIAPYVQRPTYLGATVGRYANRIAEAAFTLDGRTYCLSSNDSGQSLHGGAAGFDQALWTVEAVGDDWVRLGHISPDGDQGYPGTLTVAVTYRLDGNTLCIEFEATTDRPTVVNLTNHALFNLRGEGGALDAELTIHADRFMPVDARLIPTGASQAVVDTVFDFTTPRRLDDGVRADDAQIRTGRGYDHNFVLRGGKTEAPKAAARLYDRLTGRGLDIATTEPGLQLYTGNFLDGTLAGKGGRFYRQGDGIALETQGFPDAPNRSNFPEQRLDPGETYVQRSIYRLFSDGTV